jgi:archaellum component FlaC
MSKDIHDKLDRMENKVDALAEKMSDVNIRLVEYNSELTRHIEGVQLAREENRILKEMVHKEVEPIKDHIKMVNWAFKALALVAAIILGMKELGLFGFIKKLY